MPINPAAYPIESKSMIKKEVFSLFFLFFFNCFFFKKEVIPRESNYANKLSLCRVDSQGVCELELRSAHKTPRLQYNARENGGGGGTHRMESDPGAILRLDQRYNPRGFRGRVALLLPPRQWERTQPRPQDICTSGPPLCCDLWVGVCFLGLRVHVKLLRGGTRQEDCQDL